MADALPTKNRIPDFDTYPAVPSGSEDSPASLSSRTYMPGTSGSTGAVPGYKALPERSSVSALEARAAQVGGVMGRAVATVRRGRGKFVIMKSRGQEGMENLSGKAGRLKSSARELAGSAQQRASEFAYEAQQRASELAQNAQERISGFAEDVRERTAELSRTARQKSEELRERAGENYRVARRRTLAYVDENPLQALGIIAGAGVVLGAALRIVRSRNAREY